jgi:hypothetical protein
VNALIVANAASVIDPQLLTVSRTGFLHGPVFYFWSAEYTFDTPTALLIFTEPMADMPPNNPLPGTPSGAEPMKKSTGKVQPKKETVRINLPPKPTAAPTIKLPTLPPGGPTGAPSPAPAPTAATPAPSRHRPGNDAR